MGGGERDLKACFALIAEYLTCHDFLHFDETQ